MMTIRKTHLMVLLVALVCLAQPALAESLAAKREAHWRAGTAAFEDGLYAVAEDELQDYLKLAVEDPNEAARASEAAGLLARAMLAENRSKDLLGFLKENRWWMRDAAPGAIPFWRALTFYEMKDLNGALAELEKFDKEYHGSAYAPRALRLSAWCQFQLGNTNVALDAFADFDKAFRGTIEGAENRLEWAQVLIAAGKLAKADALLATLGQLTQDSSILAKGEFWRSRVLLEGGRWAEAVVILEKLAAQDIGDPDVKAECAFALGRARGALGDLTGAAAALSNGLAVAKNQDLRLAGSRRLGLLDLELGRIDEGVALLREFIAQAPTDPRAEDTQLALADALLNAGRLREAGDAYQHYLESFTNQVGVARAYKGRGWALQGLKRYAEAAVAFEKAYAAFIDPEERADCLYKEGDAFFANQQNKLAAQVYARLLDEYPKSAHAPSVLYQLAQCQSLGETPTIAEATYRKLADAYPDNPLAGEALLRIAQLREAMGQFETAADGYGSVITAVTNSSFTADALLGRGLVRYRLGRYPQAFEDFSQVVANLPDAPQAEEARFRMIMCTYLLGRDAAALESGRAFLAQDPHSRFAPRVQYWLGNCAFNASQYAEAEAYFMDFYAGHPTDRDAERALLWAGRSAARSEEYLRANEILTTLLKDFPQGTHVAEARYEQGVVLTALAKFAEAILAFQEVVNRYPNSELIPETWLRIGDCQFMLGVEDPTRYEQAIAAYRAASTHPNAKVDLILQAEYKIGRCLQKSDKPDEAIAQYYKNVMVRFLDEQEARRPQSEAARTWFGRAARDTADVLQERNEWGNVVNILERAIDAGVPDEAGLRERIRVIRAEHWWLFY